MGIKQKFPDSGVVLVQYNTTIDKDLHKLATKRFQMSIQHQNALIWFRIKTAAAQVDTTERIVRDWLRDGLRHSKAGRKIFIKPEWLNEYLEAKEVKDLDLDSIVEEALDGIKQ